MAAMPTGGRGGGGWPGCLLISRGEKNYYRLCAKYGFEKPNDERALELMNAAAKSTMEGVPEVGIGYGVSDEFRYLKFPPTHSPPSTQPQCVFFFLVTSRRERDTS